MDNLIEICITSIDRPRAEWRPTQEAAATTLLETIQDLKNSKDVMDTLRVGDGREFGQSFLGLISEIFFAGTLPAVEFLNYPIAVTLDKKNNIGNTAVAATKLSPSGKISIGVEPGHHLWHKNSDSRKNNWLKYVSVLLHEMTHAACFMFCSASRPEQTTGHYKEWQYLAFAIETRAQSELGLSVNLGRTDSLVREHEVSNTAILAPRDIQHWFGDAVYIHWSENDGKWVLYINQQVEVHGRTVFYPGDVFLGR
jgi:hypothetical protein